MEKFKDIWASIVSQIHERTTNPLTFSFVISWLIWNYRFIFIAFSELPVKEKLSLIKSFYPDWHIAGQEGFVYPLLTSLAYVFIYPFIAIVVINFSRDQQIRQANSIKRLEKERLLTREDATALQRRHEKSRAKASEIEGQLQLELSDLREALQSAENEISKLQNKIPTPSFDKLKQEVVESFQASQNLESNLDNSSTSDVDAGNVDIVDIVDNKYIRLNNPIPGTYLNKNNALTGRQLKILSLLSEGINVDIQNILNHLNVKRLFIDSDLDVLRELGLVIKASNLQMYKINAKGRSILKAYIEQGLWIL